MQMIQEYVLKIWLKVQIIAPGVLPSPNTSPTLDPRDNFHPKFGI
jgi:hypothetical protein